MIDGKIIEKTLNRGIMKGIKKANGPIDFDLVVVFLAKISRGRVKKCGCLEVVPSLHKKGAEEHRCG